METEKEKYERKMKIVRERYGLNSFEEVEAELRRMGPLNIGILVSKRVPAVPKGAAGHDANA